MADDRGSSSQAALHHAEVYELTSAEITLARARAADGTELLTASAAQVLEAALENKDALCVVSALSSVDAMLAKDGSTPSAAAETAEDARKWLAKIHRIDELLTSALALGKLQEMVTAVAAAKKDDLPVERLHQV